MQNRANPYFNMSPVRKPAHSSDAPDMFYGRADLFQRFFAAIANHQSVSLEGSWHIGKTSFLLRVSLPEVQQAFGFDGSHFLFVYLDLRKYLRKTCENFFHAVSRAIIAHCPELPGLKLHAESDSEDEFGRILEIVNEHGLFPVLLLDAFDNITLNKHFDAEFLALLRALATAGCVSYVTASVAPLNEVCHPGIAGSPFFNIFYNYPLGPLTADEARELITMPAKNAGLPFTESEIALISRLAGRHPFFIQRVCYHTFEEKLSLSNVDEQRIEKLAYDDLLRHFQDTWNRLPEAQRQAGSQGKPPELNESSIFRQFVRLTCSTGSFEITLEELEDALEKLDDAKALGETKLALLNIVARRQKNSTISTVEKGIIIRAVLNEAFERMRGSPVSNSSNPTSHTYTILYYRYFKQHNKNEQIAARISFSPRQYFRYRKKAIGELLNILFEMERASIEFE